MCLSSVLVRVEFTAQCCGREKLRGALCKGKVRVKGSLCVCSSVCVCSNLGSSVCVCSTGQQQPRVFIG